MRSKLFIGIFALCSLFISQTKAQELLNYPLDTINGEEVYKYRVEKSIGLYRIGVNFNVQQNDIIRLNPQLRERGLHYDELIYIPTGRKVENKPKAEKKPVQEEQPIAEQKSTVAEERYNVEQSLSQREETPTRLENVTMEGTISQAPIIPGNIIAQDNIATPEEPISSDSIADNRQVIELALMLPFESQQTKRSATAMRMLEFYQGALLALHDLQNDSTLYRLRVYDIERSDRRVKALCDDSTELNHVKAVLGVVYPIQIKVMAQWCETHKVPLFLPFCDNMELKGHPQIYQFNSPDTDEAQALARWINAQEDIHCVAIETREAELSTSARTLRKEMTAQGLSYTSLPMRDLINDSAAYTLIPEKENLIIVHSDRIQHVRVLLPHLIRLKNVGYRIRLVSQYSWQKENIPLPQVYTTKFSDETDLTSYNALWDQYFVNEHVSETPRYDLLGYDMMREIIHIINMEPGESGLQSPIYWEAESEQDGWQNTYINIVEK